MENKLEKGEESRDIDVAVSSHKTLQMKFSLIVMHVYFRSIC